MRRRLWTGAKSTKENKIGHVQRPEQKPWRQSLSSETLSAAHAVLFPFSGYYEWQDTPGGKQPWYFAARDDSPALAAVGVWDQWRNPETGEPLKSCTMIITEPNDFVAEVHDRMPVLLTAQQFEPWLTSDAGLERAASFVLVLFRILS